MNCNLLFEKGIFTFLDLYFPKILLKEEKEDEDVFLFLSYLFSISRNGHICLNTENKGIFPLPDSLSLEEKKELIFHINEGIKKCPSKYLRQIDDKEFFPLHPICSYQNHIYLQKNWVYENELFQQLSLLLKTTPDPLFSFKLISEKFQDLIQAKVLLPSQAKAIKIFFTSSLTLIFGGPGTGKTYTASFLVKLMIEALSVQRKIKVIIAAPTGKASFHLRSKMEKADLSRISLKAVTLHALLGIHEDRHIEFNKKKIDADCILVDEASMIDIRILAHLFSCLKEGARLVLIGDPDQLSPVESGQAFFDLSQLKEQAFAVHLEYCIRFSSPTLLSFAKAVQSQNQTLAISQIEKQDEDLLFVDLNDKKNNILDLIIPYFPKPSIEHVDPQKVLKELNQFRVLSCLRQGVLGADQLNQKILKELFSHLTMNEYFAVPIIITENDYHLDLYNGMTGVVIGRGGVIPFGKNAKAYFFDQDDSVKEISIFSIRSWDYAYVLSVHKSQGSEFDTVVAILTEKSEVFGKEILYTAATRAKKKLILAGDKEKLIEVIEKSSCKVSGLQSRLQSLKL